jgi:hypothetical protein
MHVKMDNKTIIYIINHILERRCHHFIANYDYNDLIYNLYMYFVTLQIVYVKRSPI